MNSERRITLFLFPLLSSLISIRSFSLNDPSISWKYTETEHFFIVYHDESEKTAEEVFRKCEQFYSNISSFFDREIKGKITIVVRNTDDISNAYAMYTLNNVTMWTSNLHFPIRDKHRWIDNVLYHELTHIFQQSISSKTSPRIPASLVSFGVAKMRNSKFSVYDTIFQAGGNVFLNSNSVPSWFVEGIAQYVSSRFGDENYDPVREMILRTFILENEIPSSSDILNFREKRGVKAELVYNIGFSLLRFMEKKFGEEKIKEVVYASSNYSNLTFSMSLKNVTGMTFEKLYEEWKEEMKDYVEKFTSQITEPSKERVLIKGKDIQLFPVSTMEGIFYLSVSPSGEKAEIKFIKDISEKPKSIIKDVSGKFDASNDGKILVFTKREINYLNHLDTKLYIFKKGEGEKNIPDTDGFQEPDLSPDGNLVAAVKRGDGTYNLRIIDLSGKTLVKKDMPYGWEIHNPSFSPDGKRVVFEIYNGENIELGLYDMMDDSMKIITRTPENERFPRFIDGEKIIFSKYDERGIYNIYSLDLKKGILSKMTNTLKGNFMPEYSNKFKLIYACFTSKGFKICSQEGEKNSPEVFQIKGENVPSEFEKEKIIYGKKYIFIPSKINFYPQLLFADYQLNLGGTLTFSDQLFTNNFNFTFFLGTRELQYFDLFFLNRNLPVSLGLEMERTKYIFEDRIILSDGGEEYSVGNAIIFNTARIYAGERIWKDIFFTTGAIYDKIEDTLSIYWPPQSLTRSMETYYFPFSLLYAGDKFKLRGSFFWAKNNDLNPGLPSPLRFREYTFVALVGSFSYSSAIYGPFSMSSSLSLGYINKNVHSIHEFYLGGSFYPFALGDIYAISSLPGYPYLSIHGEQFYLLNFTLKYSKTISALKILSEILTIHGFSLGIFADTGTAYPVEGKWEKLKFNFGDLKTDAGIMGQLKMNLFYEYPWDMFIIIACPFNNIRAINVETREFGEYPNRGKIKIYLAIGVYL